METLVSTFITNISKKFHKNWNKPNENVFFGKTNHFKNFSVSVKVGTMILAAGRGNIADHSFLEILAPNSRTTIQLPNLPYEDPSCSIFIHNGTLMICGGYREDNPKKCYQLSNGIWTKFSDLNCNRFSTHVVSTNEATYLFGGNGASKTFEFLPKNGKTWKLGENEIPKGFCDGSAVEIKSRNEIWLIGGTESCKRILIFDLKTHIFKELPSTLNRLRFMSKSISLILNGIEVILVTGGNGGRNLRTVEIINTQDGSCTLLTNKMVFPRLGHGIGILKIENQEKIAVFGGSDGKGNPQDSVEIFDIETKEWKLAENIKLKEARYFFPFINFI